MHRHEGNNALLLILGQVLWMRSRARVQLLTDQERNPNSTLHGHRRDKPKDKTVEDTYTPRIAHHSDEAFNLDKFIFSSRFRELLDKVPNNQLSHVVMTT